MRICKSKNRQHNDQKKKYKRTNNNLQNIHIQCKTNDRVTRTPLNTGGELMCSGTVGSSCSTMYTRRVNLITSPVISHEWGPDRDCHEQIKPHQRSSKFVRRKMRIAERNFTVLKSRINNAINVNISVITKYSHYSNTCHLSNKTVYYR